MAAGAAVSEAPLLLGLLDEIVVWEIFLRLPPKSLLRCRAVSPAWRSATSTRDFLFAHHHRQPTLPLLRAVNRASHDEAAVSQDIIPLDHAAGDQLQSVARLSPVPGHYFHLEAACDGLLVLHLDPTGLSICNPATREYAPLPQLGDFDFAALYLHTPTCEYRLLLYSPEPEEPVPDAPYAFYVFTLGSSQPPRYIGEGCPDGCWVFHNKAVLLHASLHWCKGQKMIAFDTTAESFRRMRSPAASTTARLFEIGGMLGVSSLNKAAANIDIWVMPDYRSEVWAFKHRVELPVAQLTVPFGKFRPRSCVVIPSRDGDVLVLVKFGEWLLHIDTNGKLAAFSYRELLRSTQLRLQQTLVPHAFFPTLEGYVVNAWPFI